MPKVEGKVDAGVDGIFQHRNGRRDLIRGVRRHGIEMRVLRRAQNRRATESLQ